MLKEFHEEHFLKAFRKQETAFLSVEEENKGEKLETTKKTFYWSQSGKHRNGHLRV